MIDKLTVATARLRKKTGCQSLLPPASCGEIIMFYPASHFLESVVLAILTRPTNRRDDSSTRSALVTFPPRYVSRKLSSN